MTDILLDLPDELHRWLEQEAARASRSLEDHIRSLLIAGAPAKSASIPLRSDAPTKSEITVQAEIQEEYRRLGYKAGWRFITCPAKNIATAKVVMVSVNPSGDREHGPSWSQEQGSAYFIESWDNQAPGTDPLQRQIQAMFRLLDVDADEVLSAHFVPFRSPTWDRLARQREALAFGERLWRWLLPQTHAKLIVVLGKGEIGLRIAKIAGAHREVSFPIGWGNHTADRYALPDGGHVVALPHPGRFQVFGREASRQALHRVFFA